MKNIEPTLMEHYMYHQDIIHTISSPFSVIHVHVLHSPHLTESKHHKP